MAQHTRLLRQAIVHDLQDLPKEDKIKVDEVQVTPVTQHVTAFRAICTQRLKFEIEYGLKRGTTDNCYLIQVCLSLRPPCVSKCYQAC